MAPTPSPEDTEQVLFFIRWWQEILSGSIVILMGLFLKAKGSMRDIPIPPMTEAEIDMRLTICKQSVLLALNDIMGERDKVFFKHVKEQNEELLRHIKDIIGK